MNATIDAYLLGLMVLLVGAFQLVPIAVAAALGEPVEPLVLSALAAAIVGGAVVYATRPGEDRRHWRLRPRDGFIVVGLGWVLISLFGAIPFYFTGTLGLVDSIFESVAGFTTTGSSVMTDIEGAQRGLLLWRSLIQWLGGMGIVLFTIAVLPLLSVGGMQLFKAEVPGPVADKLEPRVEQTARQLWLIYVALTAAEILLLRWVGGMSWFDAVCHGFTTMATGGFSTRNESVGAYASPAIEWIVIVFMLSAGINFQIYYRLLRARFGEVWRDAELRYFLLLVAAAAAVVVVDLSIFGQEENGRVRTALFQVVSIVTTTGYATADFEAWPALAQLVLLQLMLLGGMAGSTAGGVKSLRVILGLGAMRVAFSRLVHPHAVQTVKYGGRSVPDDVLAAVWAFFTTYALVAAGVAAVVAATGSDVLTSISASLTALSNVGPGLGEVGPYDNFAALPGLAKLALSFGMIAGRLELFTILILFSPGFWRR